MRLLYFSLCFSFTTAFNFDIPCDFPEKTEFVNSSKPYIIRNSSLNAEFNALFTAENLLKELENTTILTYLPYAQPSGHQKENFGERFRNHFLKYANMSMKDILSQEPLDTRYILTRFNSTHPILPKYILEKHKCEFLGPSYKSQWNFFIGAKGQGTNFHAHMETWTQTTSGKKLWMFPEDGQVLQQLGMTPNQSPSSSIKMLLREKSVKKCIANKNDIIYIPHMKYHGVFNLENSLANSCVHINMPSEAHKKKIFAVEKFVNIHTLNHAVVPAGEKNECTSSDEPAFMKKKQKVQRLPMKQPKVVAPAEVTEGNIDIGGIIPCNIPEYAEPVMSDVPYIIRNATFNKEFNAAYTVEKLKEHLGNSDIMSFHPGFSPDDYKRVPFTDFIDTHVLKYDNWSIYKILSQKRLDVRMPFMRYNTTHPILSDEMLNKHDCSFANHLTASNKTHWDYFLSAKGQSVNFHTHNAIFTQITSGKKLWLFPEDGHVLEELKISKLKTPAYKINKIINHPRVKTCVAEKNDVTFVPHEKFHGVFNLETTMAHGCVIFKSKEQYTRQMRFKTHVNIHDL